jgi:hypothetical protein
MMSDAHVNDRFANDCGVAQNRFKDACLIQQGACNPSGIARTLVRAINACHAEGADARTDPAVRMIAHQLAFILGVDEINTGFDTYSRLTQECEARALVQPVRG